MINEMNDHERELAHEQKLLDDGNKRVEDLVKLADERNYSSSTKHNRCIISTYAGELSKQFSKIYDDYEAKKLAKTNIKPYVQAIHELIEAFDVFPSGITDRSRRIQRGEDYLTALTMKGLFDKITVTDNEPVSVVEVASKIGEHLDWELFMLWYQLRLDEEEFRWLSREASRDMADLRNRRTTATNAERKILGRIDVAKYPKWTTSQRIDTGLFMLDCAMSAGLISTKREFINKGGKQAKHKSNVIVLTEVVQDEINRLFNISTTYSYLHNPMVCVPKEWGISESGEITGGGYYDQRLRRATSFVRGFDNEPKFGQLAVDFTNMLGRVAWKTDERIVETVAHLTENKIPVDSLKVVVTEKPPKGHPSNTSDTKEARDEANKRISQQHFQHEKEVRASTRSRKSLSVAQEYKKKDIFNPWSLDFRGRAYPISTYLQPQAPEFEKALIRFKEGCHLDERGELWALRAIGGAYNGSKISHNERGEWALNNMELIRAVADEPESTINYWEQANEPFQFLQLCREWNDVVVHERDYLWKVGIGSDSTASGLQLLSAMLLDESGMKYTNLLPQSNEDKPEDAYRAVLNEGTRLLIEDSKWQPYAYLDKYLGWRSLGKPTLMLSVYGGSLQGIRQRIYQALIKEGCEIISRKKHPHTVSNDTRSIHYDDVNNLAKLLLKASHNVFPKAYEALTFLNSLALTAHKKGASRLTWTMPTGETIDCNTRMYESRRVRTRFLGQLRVVDDLSVTHPDIKSQRSGFPPNFIHSYDSLLLRKSFHNWSRPITCVHDCVKVLPNDMEDALSCIRENFQEIVGVDDNGNNPLSRVADDLGVTAEELPRPKLGKGSLDNIRFSKYMFN